MDKTKSEKLKEILNQKLSSDEIEKKLKKEAKALNKKENKEQKNIENQEKKKNKEEEKKDTSEAKEEKVVIPTIRDKEPENNESNLLLYLVLLIAILLLILTIYLFTKDDSSVINKKESSQKTIVENVIESKPEIKDLVNKEITEVLETKKELKKEEPTLETIESKKIEKEISKEQIPKKLEEKTTEIKTPEKIENNESNTNKKEEIIKEKIVTKIVNLDKENFKKYYNSSKYNTLKCYNFKAGDIFPDAKCKKDLVKFINNNKKAIRFEIIAVLAQDDNTIFDKIKPNLTSLEANFQDRVKEYMFRGLGRERVLETSWQVKDILGEDTVLTPTNYYVKSKKNNKGIIIKAYH